MGQLDGKIAIVTGGGAGIGQATVLRFVAEGARVVVNDRQEARVEQTLELIRQVGGVAEGLAGDVTDSATVAQLVDLAVERFGRLDVMFSNAGTGLAQGALIDLEDRSFQKDLQLNLAAMFYCLRESLRVMLPAGQGSIICTSSASAVRAVPATGAYASAKAGVLALVRSGAVEAGPSGVRVNAIVPGAIATEALLSWFPKDEGAKSGMSEGVPLGRMGRPKEIAAAALWLASDDSSFVTGTSLLVDGGAAAGRT